VTDREIDLKRPIPIYFIAGWSFLVLTLQTRGLAKLAEAYCSNGEDPGHLWGSFRGLLLILVLWHVVRLIQLKAFNRWLSFISFVLATISTIWYATISVPRMTNPLTLIASSTVAGLLCIASCMYLGRSRFKQFAARFDSEREREKHLRMMQKASQKAVSKEIKR
jgi:hypothetical protein